MSTKTRFEKEAKGNSEMVYYISSDLTFEMHVIRTLTSYRVSMGGGGGSLTVDG